MSKLSDDNTFMSSLLATKVRKKSDERPEDGAMSFGTRPTGEEVAVMDPIMEEKLSQSEELTLNGLRQ